jgi:hypothetical protein
VHGNSEDALGIQLPAHHWHLIRRGSGPAFFFAVVNSRAS